MSLPIAPPASSLREQALAALHLIDAAAKVDAVRALAAVAQARPSGDIRAWEVDRAFDASTRALPGRPAKPEMVSPRAVPRRGLNSVAGRAVLLHALAHIEFNAINLALDAIWRFAGMPVAFYRDWLQVADEEALHFSLLRAHLQNLGYDYGDFAAHNGLWDMAEKTAGDPLARMALVPRLMEARGLDVSPPIRAKLAAAGDHEAAKILDVILRDEIGHVAIGNRWYRWLCVQRGVDPLAIWPELAARYDAPALRGPFNLEARVRAGFDADELAALEKMARHVQAKSGVVGVEA